MEALPAVRSRIIDVDGVATHVREAGDGRPLLLLHGIAGDSRDWGDVLPSLARGWRVVAPDAPGHGRTPPAPPGEVWDLARFVRFARDLVGVFGGGDPIPVAAMSGGGAIALGLAVAAPAMVDRVALIASAGLGCEVSWGYRAAAIAGPVVRQALRRTTPWLAGAFGRRLCFHADRVPAGWAERRAALWRSPGAADAFVATARATVSWRGQRTDFVAALPSIAHEVLIIWGRHDPVVPVAHAYRAAKLLPRATLHVIDRCGHIPTWEYPEVVAARVTAFLAAARHS